MRNAKRLVLIGCGLLLLVGLGWYAQHPDQVHGWLRSLGRKSLAADEVIVKQRASAVLPTFDGEVTVRIGDIKRGKSADVEIIGPDSAVLAAKNGVLVGDRIAFTHAGKEHEIEVVQYLDEIGGGDSARIRVIP